MRLIKNGLLLLFNIIIRRKSRGESLRIFCSSMGLAYIKFAQILAMQNINGIFSEQDRQDTLSVCDSVNPIGRDEISELLLQAYNGDLSFIKSFDWSPIGSASISQVHKAVLYNGDTVVIKIKRKDVYRTVVKDIKQIRILVKLFGCVFGFNNKSGSETGLYYFQKWLMEEMDFCHELRNIIRYSEFADSVNGKVPGCCEIKVPKVYPEYSNDCAIVM